MAFAEEGTGGIKQDVSQGEVSREFQSGIAVAMDPLNDFAITHGGKAVTTLSSYWLHRVCPTCQHTFRLGDEVEIGNDGVVRHRSVLLPCTKDAPEEMVLHQETAEFFMGMDETWPPPADMPVHRLFEGHELLAPPLNNFRRHTCAVCGHTLRPHDHVIICPCSPENPHCLTAIHRDPLHGLHCYEAWNPRANKQDPGKPDFCPVTSRKL